MDYEHKEKCLVCGRYIGLTRRGLFRRHMSSPGIVCAGAWQSPEKQKLEITVDRIKDTLQSED